VGLRDGLRRLIGRAGTTDVGRYGGVIAAADELDDEITELDDAGLRRTLHERGLRMTPQRQLVLDAIAFIDTTWLGRGGFFHSTSMHVVEKFTRQGDVLLYDVTVEDPEVLVEPYVFPTRTVRRNPNPNAGLLRERGNCEIYEDGAAVTQIRH